MWTLTALAALPDVDTPLKTGADAPHDAAVVAGIEDYYELPDVPFAERDAQAFADYLLYTRGVPSDRVARVAKANREKLLAAVELAGRAAGPEGTVWVYFAGHGAASPTTGERMVLGIDVQPDLATFGARSVTVAELEAAATAGGARAVLVLDACYTGRGRSGDELLPGTRFAVPATPGAGRPRVLTWSAASENQLSGPLEPARHGAFTYAVLGALRGWADGQLDEQPDGAVTAEEASLYVEEALRALGVTDQRPALEGADGWVLASHPRPEPRPVLAPSALAPSAPEPAVERPAPNQGTAELCFRRSRALTLGAARLQVESGQRTLAAVALGGTQCAEVDPGTHVLVASMTAPTMMMRNTVTTEVAAGERAWFLVGATGMFGVPQITEVSESQYADGVFALLK